MKIAEIQKQLDELIEKETKIAPKSVALASPIGGEKWEVGKTYDIKWNTTGYSSDSNVQIKLLDTRYEGNSTKSETTIINTTNNGVYSWEIPDLLNGNRLWGSLYKISVSIEEGSDKLSDVSDSYFSITTSEYSYLNVIFPNGGETLKVEETYTIKWDSPGWEGYKVDITLKQNLLAPLAPRSIASRITNNSYYDWEIPQNIPAGGYYRISVRIYDNYGNLVAYNQSSNNFSIAR